MALLTFDPYQHHRQVAELWERALGDCYPVTDRVLRPRLFTNDHFELGDAVVQLDGDNAIGFGNLEINRRAGRPPDSGSIQAVLVDPTAQRRGLGNSVLAELEQRARDCGIDTVTVSRGFYRFWTGVPDDLPGAQAFFAANGYERIADVIDMYGSLADFEMSRESTARLADMGMAVVPLTDTDLSGACLLLEREAHGKWLDSLLLAMVHGDAENMLAVKHGADVVGCIQTFTPGSRFRGPNVVWERIYGTDMGGFGAVSIAEQFRGRGLGTAMCESAAAHIRRQGGSGCFIDWTGPALVPFYGAVGATVCSNSGMYEKPVG